MSNSADKINSKMTHFRANLLHFGLFLALFAAFRPFLATFGPFLRLKNRAKMRLNRAVETLINKYLGCDGY
jgi:hypothetical protein